ncbi:hypothetical protein BSKO_13257 [Bryopsis sp. KO-2023]|nr:hypothetical protein BSKO_13257 [Bryopsis sp. KO-2023]
MATLAFLLFVVGNFALGSGAIDDKCGACRIVSEELQKKLDKELPRNHLDMRHRLDATGKRYGKVIEYSASELRMTELLDNLCEKMSRYTWGYVMPPAGGEMKLGWLSKSKSKDIAYQMDEGEESLRRKHLKAFCGRLIEEHEEELVEALRSGIEEEKGLSHLLCTALSKTCPQEKENTVDKANQKAEL